MATRTDVIPRWNVSPRILRILAPSLIITQQDLVDTARILEYSWRGMSEKHLIDATGKDDLGGGLFVGITSQLQNTQIEFQARSQIHSSGTVTTNSGGDVLGAIQLIDSGASFISASNVARGHAIRNETDRSLSHVIDIVSDTTLLVDIPLQGTNNDYRIGDIYTISDVAKGVVTGGNLTAVDELLNGIEAVIPIPHTQVEVEKAVSAALLDAGAAPTDVNVISIDGSTLAAELLRCSAETMARGTVTDATSASLFEVTFTETVLGQINGRLVFFKDGSKIRGVTRIISTVDQGSNTLELTTVALASTPTVGLSVILV